MQAAVIGHVEWVEFARVESFPAPGEIVHAGESWAEAAGGGAVAAVQLANLGCDTTLFTALGDDELGRRSLEQLEARGVRVRASIIREPQRRAFTLVDDTGERTITVIGEKLRPSGDDGALPWEELRRCDCVYFTGGDVSALRKGRWAQVLVATARELATLSLGSVELGLGGAGEHVALHPARLLAERIQRGESRLDESSPILTTVGVEAAFEATGDEDALSECLPELGRESKAILVIERVFVLAEEHR